MFTPRASYGTAPDDPLTQVLNSLIPADETPAQRSQRLALEQEARRVSDEIDEKLRQERAERRNQKIVKILLLGKSAPSITGTLVPSSLRMLTAQKARASLENRPL
jgi:guanine nucleotide-binding protein subunit alpha